MHTYTVQNSILGTGYGRPPFFLPRLITWAIIMQLDVEPDHNITI